MAKAVKQHGRVYTPDYLVKVILDFGGYDKPAILKKHVIDNSCGDGAFLMEIVRRYCTSFLTQKQDLSKLKHELETYIHGIELDAAECDKCIQSLNNIVEGYGISKVKWDVVNTDTLTVDRFNGKMDYVFGNPPYVRVHNLENSYETVKKFKFAEGGMTDLFIVFFEIGFNMLAKGGLMCLITPSSWLGSLAGTHLRQYIHTHQNLSGVIDLEHFQPFEATTYTFISRFSKSKKNSHIDYYTFDGEKLKAKFQEKLSYSDIQIGKNFYFSKKEHLSLLNNIKTTYGYPYASVKNGFATLADKVFIGDFDFTEGTIDILKASTGKWSKCIYPYDKKGKPLPLKDFMNNTEAYNHLLSHQDKLSKSRDIEDDKFWYLFGRTQALKDVSKVKYAINTLIKDKGSIKLECVPQGAGIYSGLYILTDIEFETIKQLVYSEDFINYIKLLKNYKSGGYYTFASKDLEQYLNYKLSEKYGQSRISNGSRELF
ncbi:MAG: N-6 DNA methylase [Bacteroidales bacterium]|nr:N-6 DNA methylase [Bacteroidales bacterium]